MEYIVLCVIIVGSIYIGLVIGARLRNKRDNQDK
jgi:hypothetical protein